MKRYIEYLNSVGAAKIPHRESDLLTHSRNVFGNVVFMAANGFTPIGLKSGKEAVEYSIAKLGGLNNRELAEKMSRYRELGLTGSDVGISIIKRNFQDLGMDPITYFKKALNAK